MTKSEITAELLLEFKNVGEWYEKHPENKFEYGPVGKWNAAQILDHLITSAKPINLALSLPKLALGLKFGKSKKESRSYDEVVSVYQQALADGGKAPANFEPPKEPARTKEKSLAKLAEEGQKLAAVANKWSDADLDKYQLPHPLIGNLSIRELLQFTIYHMRHHLKGLKAEYE